MPWAPIGRGILARPFCEQTTRGADDPYVVVNLLGELRTDATCRYIRAYRKSPATETVVNRLVLGHLRNDIYADSRSSVDEIAKKRGISMAQIAIAWLLSKEGEHQATFIPQMCAYEFLRRRYRAYCWHHKPPESAGYRRSV